MSAQFTTILLHIWTPENDDRLNLLVQTAPGKKGFQVFAIEVEVAIRKDFSPPSVAKGVVDTPGTVVKITSIVIPLYLTSFIDDTRPEESPAACKGNHASTDQQAEQQLPQLEGLDQYNHFAKFAEIPVLFQPRAKLSEGYHSVRTKKLRDFLLDETFLFLSLLLHGLPFPNPAFTKASLAVLLIMRNRSGPSCTPPYHRVTTTITFQTSINCMRCSNLPPAAVSPSSS